MHLRHSDPEQAAPVRMDGAADVRMQMLVGRDDGAPTFAMRQFTVEAGGHTPHHHHPYEHGVFVTGGRGTVEIGEETREIAPGDALFVPADRPHQFRTDRGEPLQFLCMVPTTFDCGQPTPGS